VTVEDKATNTMTHLRKGHVEAKPKVSCKTKHPQGSLQERVSKICSLLKSTQIVPFFFSKSALKLENQFLKNHKNMFSI